MFDFSFNCPKCNETIDKSYSDKMTGGKDILSSFFDKIKWKCLHCNEQFSITDIDIDSVM